MKPQLRRARMVNKSRCYRNFTLAGVHEPTIDPSTANLQSQSHPRRHPAAPNAGIEKKPNSQIILCQARSRLTVAHDSRFPRTDPNSSGQEKASATKRDRARRTAISKTGSSTTGSLPQRRRREKTLVPIDNLQEPGVPPPSSSRDRQPSLDDLPEPQSLHGGPPRQSPKHRRVKRDVPPANIYLPSISLRIRQTRKEKRREGAS